jgi:hypothetical protein
MRLCPQTGTNAHALRNERIKQWRNRCYKPALLRIQQHADRARDSTPTLDGSAACGMVVEEHKRSVVGQGERDSGAFAKPNDPMTDTVGTGTMVSHARSGRWRS